MVCVQENKVSQIVEAQHRIERLVFPTPLVKSSMLSDLVEGDIFLKLENIQQTGSFKIRGACNKILLLSEQEKKRGIVACSAGNHAQGVAFVTSTLGIETKIFMPLNAPESKVHRTKRLGAKVCLVGENFEETKRASEDEVKKTAKTFIHPYEDESVIEGQGTIGLEILKEKPDVETILVPIGGGGLIAGITVVIKELCPRINIIGIQSENVHGMIHSLHEKRIISHRKNRTIADGCNVAVPGTRPFNIIQNNIEGTIVVSESEIKSAIEYLLQEEKIIAEGAGALTTAAILSGKAKKWVYQQKAVAIISGGNIDNNLLREIIK